MKPQQITNAIELFKAACQFERLTPDIIREDNYNHEGFNFDNKPQYIAMDASGEVFIWSINPASLISGSALEHQDLEMFYCDGVWDSHIGTVSNYVGNLQGELRALIAPSASCFRIDESFTEFERVECACCNGHGQVSEMMREDGVCCDDEWIDVECPDCLGCGSVPVGKS